MKQNARYLMMGTVIQNKVAERGTLRDCDYFQGKLHWLIDFEGREFRWVPVEEVQHYELVQVGNERCDE